MKKEILTHIVSWLVLFTAIILLKRYFNLSYWPFLVGGLLGVFLPDIDHLIYILFIKPQDLNSQRVSYLLDRSEIEKGLSLLYDTRYERKNLIFHSLLFQIIFFILTFWVMSSSSSLFGRGLVLSFSLHLLVDQFVDFRNMGTFDNWLTNFPMQINIDIDKAKIYWLGLLLLTVAIGILL